MKIIYSCSYPISGSGGKERATKAKLYALRKIGVDVHVITPRYLTGPMCARALRWLQHEVELIAHLLLHRTRYDWYISRGLSGIVALPLCLGLRIPVAREMHAFPRDEIRHLKKKTAEKYILYVVAAIQSTLDLLATVRIFNNPLLMEEYQLRSRRKRPKDFVAYNGGDVSVSSTTSQVDARRQFDLLAFNHILVFVGSASKWHGVDYLVELQTQFNMHTDGIQIVCGGGAVNRDIDPEKLLLNITPLNDIGCADLIRAADLCLLPVKQIRKSPGSPLKLYDYIINGGATVTQEGVPGYSDEVHRYGVGWTLDFRNTKDSRRRIIALLNSAEQIDRKGFDIAKEKTSWENRMKQWVFQLTH